MLSTEIHQIMDGTVPQPSSAKLESIPLQSSDLTILCDVSTGVPQPLVPSAFRSHVFNILHPSNCDPFHLAQHPTHLHHYNLSLEPLVQAISELGIVPAWQPLPAAC